MFLFLMRRSYNSNSEVEASKRYSMDASVPIYMRRPQSYHKQGASQFIESFDLVDDELAYTISLSLRQTKTEAFVTEIAEETQLSL